MIAKGQKKEDVERNAILDKMKKYRIVLHKLREILNKYDNSLDAMKLNNNELKVICQQYHRDKDDPMPTMSNALIQRFNDAKHRTPMTIEQHLKDVGIDDDKLEDASSYPSEEYFLNAMRNEAAEKEAEVASETFESAKAKCQKEKDKHNKLNDDLRKITNRLFNGILDSFDCVKLKLLKDLKAHATLKSIAGDEPVPAAMIKLKERISIVCDRPSSDLSAHLAFKGCDRADVLQSLCSNTMLHGGGDFVVDFESSSSNTMLPKGGDCIDVLQSSISDSALPAVA